MLAKTSNKELRREKRPQQSHKKKEEALETNINTNSQLMKKTKPRFGLYFFIQGVLFLDECLSMR